MTETEILDRLLHVIVQEEMSRLLMSSSSIMDEFWRWNVKCNTYMRETILTETMKKKKEEIFHFK